MYPYHNKIKQRIKNGELIGYKFEENYPRIGKCLVLIFNTRPFIRPIRPHKYSEYTDLIAEFGSKVNKAKDIAFVCDGKECESCSFPECMHTTNVDHAKNFKKEGDKYFENNLWSAPEEFFWITLDGNIVRDVPDEFFYDGNDSGVRLHYKGTVYESELGKTIFLTREEAEQAKNEKSELRKEDVPNE